jgi:PAS domain S-box-containing protein
VAPRRSTLVTLVYTALFAVLGTGVFALPDSLSAYVWAGIGLTGAGAILYGIRRNNPSRKAPWLLMAGAVLAMCAGDVIYGATVLEPGDSPPEIDTYCYFLMFPLLTAGLIAITRSGAVLRDRSRLLDLLAFGCGATLAAWSFLLSPTIGSTDLSGPDKSSLAAYTIGDLLILFTAARMLVAARRSSALALITTGAAATLVGDVSYGLSQLGAGWDPGGPFELAYVLFYFSWGAAALRPSMVELTAPVEPQADTRLGGGWTVLLGLSLTIAPTVLIVQSLQGDVHDGLAIAAGSIITFALVITRLADALRQHRIAVDRERALREACGALVAATSLDEVTAAMRVGVAKIMPAHVDRAVLLKFNEGDEAQPYPLPPEVTNRRTRLVHTQMLRTDLREQLGQHEAALVCPLIVDRRAERDRGAGALFVAANGWALVDTQDAVEVLAAQAAMTLDRIALTDAANQRDSERYLRTVVQNTADIVLIIGDDQLLRYASPSLSTLLLITPPAWATLRDLVHPDDHGSMRSTLEAAEEAGGGNEVIRDVWSLRRADRTRVVVEVAVRDLRRDPVVRGFVVTMSDITLDHERRQETIRRALESSPAGQNRRNVTKKFSH